VAYHQRRRIGVRGTLQLNDGVDVTDELLNDRRLVQRMLAGDEDAFDAFFNAYFPLLYRFALSRLGGNVEVAEDVVQRTLCIAVDRASTWRGEAALMTWLCAICRREISGHFRRAGRRPPHVELTENLPEVRAALESLSSSTTDPEQAAVRSELAGLVHVALDRLPPHYGQVLEWKYLDGESMKEIAARLSSTPKAVESLLARARMAYRDALSTLLSGYTPLLLRGGSR
jgi:RNA polymerase sigma-70 factor (ECF subfamily)